MIRIAKNGLPQHTKDEIKLAREFAEVVFIEYMRNKINKISNAVSNDQHEVSKNVKKMELIPNNK